MIAKFDHRPMLTAALALATTVFLVVVVTLLITLPPAASPESDSGGGNPAAAAPKVMDAGGENYGWDIHSKSDSSVRNPAGPANRATPSVNDGWDIHHK